MTETTKRPYIIELEGVPAMPEEQQRAIVEFVCQELEALYSGPWPVAFAMYASMEATAFDGLPWDKAWQVIELRVLETFDLPEKAVLACDLDYDVMQAEGAKHLAKR